MNKKLSPMVVTTVLGLFRVLKNDKNLMKIVDEHKYNAYPKYKDGKKRMIEAPSDEMKEIQSALNQTLQEQFSCPSYCYSGWQGRNNIQNAQQHLNQQEYITMDISHFYPNSKEKYVKKFATEKLNLTGLDLELFIKLTCYNGHLPTGAPTSPILATLIHQELFDIINNAMEKQGIKFTLYVDDMTLSSKQHIPNSCIKYIKNVLKTHGLFLKSSKIKRFGYKGALITGTYVTQSGKHQMRFRAGHKVIKMLQAKPIDEMSIEELRGLIAKIGYVNQLSTKQFLATKEKAIKHLKKLQKNKERKQLR